MLKNIMKRTVSTFLALTLVVSTVCFFDLSGLFPTAEATISSTSYTAPDVYIMVPETFYMQATPVWSDSNMYSLTRVDFTTVQYYINNTLSGTTISTDAVRDASSGKIYFNAASGTVTDLKYSILGTNKTNVPMTAGSSAASLSGVVLDTSMTAASTRTLEWIFTCKIDGMPAEYHAYTVAYAPYYTPVGAMADVTENSNNDMQMQGMAWISGVHSYTAQTLTLDDNNSSNTIESNWRPRKVYDSNGWNRPMMPLVRALDASKDQNQSITDWFTNDSNVSDLEPTFSKYYLYNGYGDMNIGDRSIDAVTKSHVANLTVDISRNNNFQTIPNVTTGMLVSDLDNTDDISSYEAYIANYAGTLPGINYWRSKSKNNSDAKYNDPCGSFTATSGVDTDIISSGSGYAYSSIPYNDVWNRATPTSTGTEMYYIHAGATGSNSDRIYIGWYLQINVNAVNKSTLRTAVFNAQKQANAASVTNYSAINAKLKTAYAALGDPTASQTAINNAASALSGASGTDAEKTTVVRHINARTGELMPDTNNANSYESLTTNLYDTVTVSPNTYTGYTQTSQSISQASSLFDMDAWNSSSSGGQGTMASKVYDAATKTLSMTTTVNDCHTVDYRSTNVFSSGYNYFPVDPSVTYALSFDYAGTGNGDIGIHCYDKDGKHLGVLWMHRKNVAGMMEATGSAGTFKSNTYYFCADMHDGSSSLTQANAVKTRYVSLCFGGYPNNANDSNYGPAASASNPLSVVFRNVTWTPVDSLFDLNDWHDSTGSGRAGTNQELTDYDTTTRTLTIAVKANDTFSPVLRNPSYDIRQQDYLYFAVDPNETYTISYQFAGTGNGDIGIMCYDADGHFLGNAWFHKSNYSGMMEATGSTTSFRAESFDFCPATYTRPSGNTTYITPDKGALTRYISLSFGGYPNSTASSSNPLYVVFRGVRWTPATHASGGSAYQTAKANLFDSAAWAASSCAANGSGVTSVNYAAATDTITVVNSGTDTYTAKTQNNIIDSGYYYFPVDPNGTYTLDFDYASATRGEIGVICYDAGGNHIGNIWLFDSFKASGSTSAYRHHTEVISPQSNYYFYDNANRFNVHYIALTFGNYAESGQSAATCNFRNVTITAQNELFDMAQWAFRSGGIYSETNATSNFSHDDLSYDSATKSLTVTCKGNDVMSGYPSNCKTDYATVSGTNCPFFYTPVLPNTTYTFEGEFAGTGNGDLGILEYDANGDLLLPKTWRHPNSAGILNKTDSNTTFTHFSTSLTTKSNTRYIVLAFGGYPNGSASSSNPVTCIFRDVKIHLTNALTVPYTDSVVTYYYRPNVYYVSYNGNGSTAGLMNNQTFHYDTAQNLTSNAFTRVFTVTYNAHGGDMPTLTAANTTATSTFAGWATSSSANATYSNQQSVSNLTGTDGSTVTLYASWTAGTVTLPMPMRVGYSFEGWFPSASGGTSVGTVGDTYTPTANVELHAQWTTHQCTITFDNNGVGKVGNMPADMEIEYNTASDPLPAPKSPSIDGWEFQYWSTTQDDSSDVGDDEEPLIFKSRSRKATRSSSSAETYYAGDIIPVDAVNSIIYTVGNGETYTLYAVWKKSLSATFVDYNNDVRRTQKIDSDVYNGKNTYITTETITQGTYTGWTAAGWTTTRQKGAEGSSLDNLFDLDAWASSNNNGNGTRQTTTYNASTHTITAYSDTGNTASAYTTSNILTSGYDYIEVDPYKTYLLEMDYASDYGGQVGFICYDENGDFLGSPWFFQPDRGGNVLLATEGVMDYQHASIEFCPATYSINPSYLSAANRTRVHYVSLAFGTYRDSGAVTANYRNISLKEIVALRSDNNLFDFDAWEASNSNAPNNSDGRQTLTCDTDTETLTSVATMKDVMSVYNNSALSVSGFDSIEVDPYKTYTLGVDYAASENASGQIGLHFYDASGNFLAKCLLFQGTDSGYGDPHRGGDHFGESTGVNDFVHEDIEICPMTFESAYLSSFTEAQRASVGYIVLTFGNYSEDNNMTTTTVKYRNVTFTENIIYYGVYTKSVSLSYNKNTTDTVTNMPSNPASQNRVANSALGFGTDDTLNPTFALSQNTPGRTGYTYQGWNTDSSAGSGVTSGNVSLTADTTYYAIWAAHQYTIAFDKNGVGETSNMPQSITATYDAATANLPAPASTTVDGWTFQGWALDNARTTVAYTAGSPIPAADVVSYYTSDGATYTLYAVWTKTITATFIHYPNGTRTSAPVQKTVYNGADATIAVNEIPTQGVYSGWTADGWTTSEQKNARGSSIDSALTLSADVTYYGVYTKQITLTYDANTDDPSVADMPTAPAAQTRIANSYFSSFNTDNTTNPTFTVSSDEPTRTGYNFGGWGNYSSDTVGSVTGSLELTESKVLYAVWALSDYVLTVETSVGGSVAGRYISGGNLANITVSANSSQDYTVKFNYTISDLVPTPATGYTFTRWEAEGLTLTSTQQTSTNLSFNMPAGDMTLSAVFTPNPYTITYNHNALTVTQNCTYDQLVTLYTNDDDTHFAKTGYTFDCWNTSSDGQGTSYAEGFAFQTAPNFVSSGNFNLYASWTTNSYNISYALQGGSADASRPTSATFDTAFSVSAPTKNGYIFSGWTVSNMDTSTAMWGTASANTALASSATQCVNGESGSVYFTNLASANGATVTLTATWTARTYVLKYASGQDDLIVVDDTYAYDDNVTILDAQTALGTTYPGWSFSCWVVTVGEDGDTFSAGNTFNLSSYSTVSFSSLELDENNNPTVYMVAEWTARNYCIVYNTNGYSVSDIQSGGSSNSWTWRTTANADGPYLSKTEAESITLYGAYTASGSYFYLNTGTEIRFGRGWAFTSSAANPDVAFQSSLTIDDIPDSALNSATAVAGTENLYQITLYMVWSANYKPLEDKVAQFQRTYMTYPASGNTTLRGMTYANASNAVYVNAPSSAKLPAVSTVDSAYRAYGSEANALWNNNTSAADYAMYAWVAGPIGNASAWTSLPNQTANDFTSASLTVVNGRIEAILDSVIYNPCTQYAANQIISQANAGDIQTMITALDAAISTPQSSSLLSGLMLKDADLDYRLSSAEMLAISSIYGAACENGDYDGMSYTPDPDTAEFMNEVFNEPLQSRYPECETEEINHVERHHSFNSLVGVSGNNEIGYIIGLANDIFSTFGFDPTQPRSNANYFRNGSIMNFALDSNGYVINPNCPYTTESVYKLFDLIYGSQRDGTYKSTQTGGINYGNVALYYQVMSALGSSGTVLLKKPSQNKLNEIVTKMAYGYHQLILKDADYSTFLTLFRDYFSATWGTKLTGYPMNSNSLTDYADFFEETSYNRLSAFMSEYFSQPGVLKSTYVKLPAVEQKYIDGIPQDSQYIRQYKNASIPRSELGDLSAFNFAERPIVDAETGDPIGVESTLCGRFCDLIDALVPAAADYTAVFSLIAGNVQRNSDADSYMIDRRQYSTSTFYPSANSQSAIQTNYQIWWRDYAKSNAWGSTRTNADNKPAYDTVWLYRYYTQASVDALAAVIQGIDWSYDKLDQALIDGSTNGTYNNGTICKTLKDAIDSLVPKEYKIMFYKGLYPEPAQDHVSTTSTYWFGDVEKPYRFGTTVTYEENPNKGHTEALSFVRWNTLRNGLGHPVSSASSIYVTDLVLDEVLLEQWWNPTNPALSTADVSTSNNQLYTVKLYAEWGENLTLDIIMNGGTVRVTPEGSSVFYASDDGGNHPTYYYGTTLVFDTPEKTGYQFSGWSFTAGANNTGSLWNSSTGTYTFGYSGTVKTNDRLEAQWTANTFTVVFNKNHNDAVNTMSAQEFQYDTAQALSLNRFERTGFRFVEWTTNADGTGDSYTDGQVVSNLTATQNGTVNLYAQWDYADFELEFVVGSDGQWNGWQGTVQNANTLTKEITFGALYNAADEDGKTWPNDPIGVVQVSGNLTIRSTFIGWYTDETGGTLIDETSDHVQLTSLHQELYARFETETSTATRNRILYALETLNANDYTMASMQAVDTVLVDLLDNHIEATPAALTRLNNAINALVTVSEDTASGGDMTAPKLNVFENKAVLRDAIADGRLTVAEDTQFEDDVEYMLSDETGETGFVYPGKAYYTYYCYTNSTTPAIIINATDVAGTSGRVSYPVTIAMRNDPEKLSDMNGTMLRTRSGKVRSGWMQYTDDRLTGEETTRSADFSIGTNEIANPYNGDLHYFGMDFSEGLFSGCKNYNYYKQQQYVLLKPTFDATQSGKQYALYTFEVYDDSVGKLATDSAKLEGAAGTTQENTTIVSSNTTVTPTNTVTVFVEYYNSMNGHDGDAGGQVVDPTTGLGTYNDNALEVYTKFHEDRGTWVNQEKLFRNSGGAATEDFIKPKSPEKDGTYKGYIANDPIYGQTSVGSFYYLIKQTDPAAVKYWQEYERWLMENPGDLHGARVAGATAGGEDSALKRMEAQVMDDLMDTESETTAANLAKMDSAGQQGVHAENGDYIHWPYSTNTQWSAVFVAPARDVKDTLIYVHIYDRWGNTFTNILQRDLQDTKESIAAAASRGTVEINEIGGSGIQGISITELHTQNTVPVSGMTDGQEWNVVNNQFTISGLPEGSNGYRYTMTVTDNAGNEYVEDFRASSDGSVVVTVNDETMGGKYADAAVQASSVTQTADSTNGVGVDVIEEDELTMLAIEEVQPDEVAVESIPDAQLNGDAAPEEEERPDVYSFSLNEIYTVNLFADSTRDYEMTLKTTVGGILNAYVNGELAPLKGGKIIVPSGSQVQIRISAKAGYELEKLTMQFADGRTVNLVGAYNAEINDDVTIKAVFVKTDALLTVRVINGAVSGKDKMMVSPYSRAAVVAAPAPEGKVFAYWAQNGEDDVPVSYDEIYTFIVTSDVLLKAVYADAPTAQIASIAMDAPSTTHVTVVNGRYTLSYSGKITVPEDAQIVEYGLVLTNQNSDSCTADNFVIGGKINGVNVAKLSGQTLTEEGQCKININNVAAGQTRTGRLYLTVKLADGTTQTIYSNTWSELTTPAAS